MSARRSDPARPGRARMAIAMALALALLPCTVFARSLDETEKASLAATIESFDAAMRAANYVRVAETVPPRVIDAIALRSGAEPKQIVAVMIQVMQQTLQGDTKIESFGMDLGDADHRELASGAPYVLVPTETVIVTGGRRFRSKSHTLALLDDGRWFLLRINDVAQLQILRDVYPEFSGVVFPSGSTEILTP
jgi:hypothetical protein